MVKISKLTDAPIGSTIQFKYSSGTHPGTRTLQVEKRGDTYVNGIDVDSGDYRSFSNAYASNIRILVKERRIKFHVVRESILSVASSTLNACSGEELAEKYLDHLSSFDDNIESVDFDDKTGEIVVREKVKRSYFDEDDGNIVIINSKDETLIVCSDGDEVDLIYEDDSSDYITSPEKLIQRLQEHLDC